MGDRIGAGREHQQPGAGDAGGAFTRGVGAGRAAAGAGRAAGTDPRRSVVAAGLDRGRSRLAARGPEAARALGRHGGQGGRRHGCHPQEPAGTVGASAGQRGGRPVAGHQLQFGPAAGAGQHSCTAAGRGRRRHAGRRGHAGPHGRQRGQRQRQVGRQPLCHRPAQRSAQRFGVPDAGGAVARQSRSLHPEQYESGARRPDAHDSRRRHRAGRGSGRSAPHLQRTRRSLRPLPRPHRRRGRREPVRGQGPGRVFRHRGPSGRHRRGDGIAAARPGAPVVRPGGRRRGRAGRSAGGSTHVQRTRHRRCRGPRQSVAKQRRRIEQGRGRAGGVGGWCARGRGRSGRNG
ncbi:hypothetical protein LMG3481_05705 [Achromobacter deleyi]|nr:hypothetical protein LMG3481_05705 [Achromobacter deleyi]